MAGTERDISETFDWLLEQMDAEREVLKQAGSRAWAAQDLPAAEAAIAHTRALDALQARTAALRDEWLALAGRLHPAPLASVAPPVPRPPAGDGRAPVTPVAAPVAAPSTSARRRPGGYHHTDLGRVAAGTRTPKAAYCRPILQALVALGGRGRVRDVLSRVEQIMKPVLTEADYEGMNSNPDLPYWDNNANWARFRMVKDGRLKSGSPQGIWEISDAGRRVLQDGKG